MKSKIVFDGRMIEYIFVGIHVDNTAVEFDRRSYIQLVCV